MRYRTLLTLFGLLAGLGLILGARRADAQKEDDKWGTLKGRVVWGGDKIPPREFVKIDKDEKHCKEDGPIPREDWVINAKNKGVRWVFVWLKPEEGANLPVHPKLEKIAVKEVVMDQPCCKFIPHGLGMREGQVLLAKNSSPVTHNYRVVGHPNYNKGENFSLPPKTERAIKDLKAQPIAIIIGCDLHKWMSARVWVFDHPYFAVTDEDGNFEIKMAPAGKYRLMVWQEEMGYRGGEAGRKGEPITIKGGGVTDLGKLELKK
jgi:hypothetical protein